MIMARNEDGTYSQVGFVKDNAGIDTEYIYDKDGDIVFEKGFTRETSGTVPLTINGIEKDLKAWSITGNTVQNGTPTPENPVEVVGVGDRTGNLFDNSLLEQGGWKASVGTIPTKLLPGETNYTNRTRYNQIIPLLASTLSLYCPANIKINYVWIDANGISLGGSGFQKNGDTATAPEQAVSMTFILGLDNDIECTLSDFSDINLVAGSIAPESYEPYGYKIPVVTRGKNLLKLKEVNLTVQGVAVSIKNNSITVKGTAKASGGHTVYLSESFVLQPGTYFISGDIINSMVYCLTDISNSKAVIASSTSKFTLTEKIKVAFGLNFINGANYDATVNVMLNEGNKILPYEPYHEPITIPIYLDSPLYKIGDYADRLSKTEEVSVVKELVLTGKEDIFYGDAYTRFRVNIVDFETFGVRATPFYMSHYIVVSDGRPLPDVPDNAAYSGSSSDNHCIFIKTTNYTTVADFKAYLAAQYAAGTPVKVYYVMKTPETKTVEPVEIPTINGTTVIDVDTAVKPTEMYTKYKSSK